MKHKSIVPVGLMLMIAGFTNCRKTDGPDIADASFSALPTAVVAPADNQPSASKVALGKALFWDPVLSGAKDVACASCHHPAAGYAELLDLSIGSNGVGLSAARHFALPNNIPFAKRNAPTIVNTAFNGMDASGAYDPTVAPMFFDSRAKSLELQCMGPMKTLEEMAGHNYLSEVALDSIINRLKGIPEYVRLFNNVFGGDGITVANLGKAIACFERSIVSNNSPFDKYVRGETSAMTSAQIQGMQAFTNNGCGNCHSGPMFSDYQLHVLSVPNNAKVGADAGANGSYSFRTPSLRNVTLTAPYMHSGVFTSLNRVLDFYDDIGDRRSQNAHVSNGQLDGKLQRVNGRDRADIIQFLNALTDDGFDKTVPASVPSGLHVGGNI